MYWFQILVGSYGDTMLTRMKLWTKHQKRLQNKLTIVICHLLWLLQRDVVSFWIQTVATVPRIQKRPFTCISRITSSCVFPALFSSAVIGFSLRSSFMLFVVMHWVVYWLDSVSDNFWTNVDQVYIWCIDKGWLSFNHVVTFDLQCHQWGCVQNGCLSKGKRIVFYMCTNGWRRYIWM